ncbi:hypothetical protein [Ruegeria lacuscaerulensis]|uniref:hypothetical protein n=1 Tax=Ruegeria lacuscaerulensis TaxID=55218 RepID=UPI00148192D8|nr:hypothetical protein [Ruegeria lacuscaerulensis]
MKITAAFIIASLTSAADAEACLLNEVCEHEEECVGSTFDVEFVGNPRNQVRSNFGEFRIDGTSATDETTSTLRLSTGTEYVVTSQNSLMIASQKKENSNAVVYFVRTPPSTLTATLDIVAQKYVDYSNTFNARRVFEGDCEQEF